MDYQNVTLAIPKEVLRRAKLLAARRRTSLSGLMTPLLRTLLRPRRVMMRLTGDTWLSRMM